MAPATKAKKQKSGTPVNTELKKTGIMKLSHGRMFHKRGLWHIAKWKKTNEKKVEDRKPKKASRIVIKKVKGDKNGGERKVRVNRFVSIL
jgi:hypothetical protein